MTASEGIKGKKQEWPRHCGVLLMLPHRTVVGQLGNGDVLVKNTLGFGKQLLAEEKIKIMGANLSRAQVTRKMSLMFRRKCI